MISGECAFKKKKTKSLKITKDNLFISKGLELY